MIVTIGTNTRNFQFYKYWWIDDDDDDKIVDQLSNGPPLFNDPQSYSLDILRFRVKTKPQIGTNSRGIGLKELSQNLR